MPRRPEIGNIQLYPNRPLTDEDKNGYTLKFFCPIRKKRVRKNCGTRDRREARRILRDCQERLLNGEYAASCGAITKDHVVLPSSRAPSVSTTESKSWQECYDRYREHRVTRIRESSLVDVVSRLSLAERIFDGYHADRGLPEGLLVTQVMTLDMLEYLQNRLLAGDECRYDVRSPNTVNSIMGAVMAFVRFCHTRGWIPSVPHVEKFDVEEVMKGRPVTGEEFERMLESTPLIVGKQSAESWQFALRVLWESGFRIGDLMDFCWDDTRHIHPKWPSRTGHHPTIVVPSSQKNGRVQEIPMLPGMETLLAAIPSRERKGWIANPLPMAGDLNANPDAFHPAKKDLGVLALRYSNCSIAAACGVSEMAVRNWLVVEGIVRAEAFKSSTGEIPQKDIAAIRLRAEKRALPSHSQLEQDRLTKERVGRVIAMIGEEAGIVVQQADSRTGHRQKFASAHDLRRGCAQRLINLGVSAEALKLIMRHSSFSTTEKHYGALRSAQSAATEVAEKLAHARNSALVGGLMGGTEGAQQLSAEELVKLKSLLKAL